VSIRNNGDYLNDNIPFLQIK